MAENTTIQEQSVIPEPASNKDLREALSRLEQAIPGDLVVQISKNGQPEAVVLPGREWPHERPGEDYASPTDWAVGITDNEATMFDITPPQREVTYQEEKNVLGRKTNKVKIALPVADYFKDAARSGGTEEQIIQAIEAERAVEGETGGTVIISTPKNPDVAVLHALAGRAISNMFRDEQQRDKVAFWKGLQHEFSARIIPGETAAQRISKVVTSTAQSSLISQAR